VKRPVLFTTTVFAIACSGIAQAPEVALAQRLAVVNKSSNSLSLIDPVTRQEVAEIPTGYSPHEVGVSPDGVLAYVTDYGTGPEPGNTITVIDLEQAKPIAKIDLGSHTRPHGIAVESDGSIWVTTEGSQHVLHIDPLSQRILQEVKTSQQLTHQVAISEKYGRVFTANIGSGSVTVVDAIRGTVVTNIVTGAGAEGIDVSPNGERVYTTNRQAGTLSEIDVRTNRVLRTLPVGDFPIRVRVRPDGSEALVSNARGNEVVAVNLIGWRVVRRLAIGAFPVGILITPDNRTAYVANTGDDKISVIDLVNWRLDGDIVAGDEPDGLAWVPAPAPQLDSK
jgi:YVTN family beta-propeller protein